MRFISTLLHLNDSIHCSPCSLLPSLSFQENSPVKYCMDIECDPFRFLMDSEIFLTISLGTYCGRIWQVCLCLGVGWCGEAILCDSRNRELVMGLTLPCTSLLHNLGSSPIAVRSSSIKVILVHLSDLLLQICLGSLKHLLRFIYVVFLIIHYRSVIPELSSF